MLKKKIIKILDFLFKKDDIEIEIGVIDWISSKIIFLIFLRKISCPPPNWKSKYKKDLLTRRRINESLLILRKDNDGVIKKITLLELLRAPKKYGICWVKIRKYPNEKFVVI